MKKTNHFVIESITREPKPQPKRFYLLFTFLLLILTLLTGRGFYLQVVQGSDYRFSAEGNRVSVLPITAARGIIFDVNGKQLVENIASTDLVIDPSFLPPQGDDFDILDKLPPLLPDTSTEDINNILIKTRETRRITLLAKAIDHDTMLAVEELNLGPQGVRLISSSARKYPYGEVASHVLGYTSEITAQELKENKQLLTIDITGKSGIEKYYDRTIRGTHGSANVEVNAQGQPQKDLGKIEPENGSDIQLTLDIELQQFIYDQFKATHEDEEKDDLKGTVIAIDPRSGAVRALVNYPSFDNNVFSQPALRKSIHELFEDEAKPIFNRAVDGTYPPASTIKPFLVAAALQESIITPETTFNSTGGVSIGQWHFPDWKAGGHGITDAKKAIADSVNTFFYLSIGGNEEHKGLGIEKATDHLKKFGFGSPTNIDLHSEASGLLPSPEWKEEVKNERWYIGDTYNMSIGQGDILVTPLQVAVGTAALANGTYAYEPHFNKNKEVKAKTLAFEQRYLDTVRAGMRDTVLYGSGVRLKDMPVAIAGKTGTAQAGGDDTHAWFASFAPYDEPELSITVLLERAGGGDKVAVPFSQDIWDWWIENRLE